MKKCLLDMDGVIVNFVKGACKLHKRPDMYAEGENLGNHDMSGYWQMSNTQFFNGMGEDFWASLEPMPDWKEIVALVTERFGVENVCILSTPTMNKDCVAGKLAWIEKHLPQWKRSYLFGPKKEYAANKNHYLVDDYDKNTDAFSKAGGNGLLVPRPWNSKHHLRDNCLTHLKGILP